ncbi:restriction endonuclease subunit S [Paenibacillus sp. BR2-3]|uniref:restriction endonuclease subunit S n=1 Tax=Paenibacillus sp. BR2-3 TaxID=3048494 RepID=UPI0039777ACC
MNSNDKKDIPIGWARTSLGDIAQYLNGRAFKAEEWEKDGLPIVRIQNLNNPNATYNYTNKIFEPRYKIKKGDILYAWSASLGVYIWNDKEAWLNQHIFKVIPNLGINKKFIYYYLLKITTELYDKTHGSGMVHITKGKFEETNISLPPLKEQQRIVFKIEELLSELDNAIESLKTIWMQLKIYRQSVLKWAFEGKLTEKWRKGQIETGKDLLELSNIFSEEELLDKPKIPESWRWAKLKSISDIRGGVTKGRNFKDKRTIMLPYLRVANVQDGYLDLKEIKQIELLETEKSKYLLKENDILYTEGGDKDKLGRGTIWRLQIKDCIHQNHVFRARLNSDLISPHFIAYYSQTKAAKNYFYKNAKQTVNLASINMKVLSNLVIPIPGHQEQLQIVQEIESRLSLCDNLEVTIEHSMKKAELLRQSILKKAFDGKLVLQDPNDEPADLLLERIRNERVEKSNKTVKKPKRSTE